MIFFCATGVFNSNSMLHGGSAWSPLYNGGGTWPGSDLDNVPCFTSPLHTLLYKLGLSDFIPVRFPFPVSECLKSELSLKFRLTGSLYYEYQIW